MPRATDIARVSQVFLSATAQNCHIYREAVKAAVERNVKGGQVFLQRDWVAGGHFVVDVCQREVKTGDAYRGLFGHRYVWIPPDHTRSITELEFRWAVERWPRRDLPIFILLPEKGNDADRQLREWALPYIENEYPDKESAKGRSPFWCTAPKTTASASLPNSSTTGRTSGRTTTNSIAANLPTLRARAR